MKKIIYTTILLTSFIPFIANAEITQNLSIGSKGEQVGELQRKLGISPTNYFGNQTKQKVIEWQKKNGIKATGFVGSISRSLLNSVNAKIEIAKTVSPSLYASTNTVTQITTATSTAPEYITVDTISGNRTINLNDYFKFTSGDQYSYLHKTNGEVIKPRFVEEAEMRLKSQVQSTPVVQAPVVENKLELPQVVKDTCEKNRVARADYLYKYKNTSGITHSLVVQDAYKKLDECKYMIRAQVEIQQIDIGETDPIGYAVTFRQLPSDFFITQQ